MAGILAGIFRFSKVASLDLNIVNTELLLEEVQTDGHAPLKFICDTGEIYFCKYLKAISRAELNCLAYEIIANYLLKYLNLPTPEIALVKISPDTLIKEKIKFNRRLSTGDVCFGSREVKFATELHAIQHNIKKKGYDQIENPEDIIRIAFFDLWVMNVDRGRYYEDGQINYNLLLAPVENKQKIIAFDHSFIFGGVQQIGTFNPRMGVNARNMLISTPYYQNIIKYVGNDKFHIVVEEFVSLLPSFNQPSLVKLVKKLEHSWDLSYKLDERIISLLTDAEHIKTCRDLMINSIR